MFHFYTPWKRQKTRGFLAFSVGIEMEHCAKMALKMLKYLFCYLWKFPIKVTHIRKGNWRLLMVIVNNNKYMLFWWISNPRNVLKHLNDSLNFRNFQT